MPKHAEMRKKASRIMGKHKGGAHWWSSEKSKIAKRSKKLATSKLLQKQILEQLMAERTTKAIIRNEK